MAGADPVMMILALSGSICTVVLALPSNCCNGTTATAEVISYIPSQVVGDGLNASYKWPNMPEQC